MRYIVRNLCGWFKVVDKLLLQCLSWLNLQKRGFFVIFEFQNQSIKSLRVRWAMRLVRRGYFKYLMKAMRTNGTALSRRNKRGCYSQRDGTRFMYVSKSLIGDYITFILLSHLLNRCKKCYSNDIDFWKMCVRQDVIYKTNSSYRKASIQCMKKVGVDL